MAVREGRLLRWCPDGLPQFYIYRAIDTKDYDVDPETEERRHRILYHRVVNLTDRGGEFIWGAPNALRLPHYILGRSNYFFPVLGRRVTERDSSWDFTPDHQDVFPGSVSAASLLTSGGNTTNQASTATATFTPTANGLLGASWGSLGAASPTYTFTNSHAGSGAWTEVGVNHANRRHGQAYSQTGDSPGSGTITNSYSSNQTNKAWVVWEVTGHNTTTPTAQSKTGSGTSATPSITLNAAVTAGNMVVSSITTSDGSPSVTVGGGETEVAEAASSAANNERTQVQYSTDQAHDWANCATTSNRFVAIEYAAGAAAASTGVSGIMPWGRVMGIIPFGQDNQVGSL